jgi:ribosomal protein L11 methylase PrmA
LIKRISSSFKDKYSQVFINKKKIIRAVNVIKHPSFNIFFNSNFFKKNNGKKFLLTKKIKNQEAIKNKIKNFQLFLSQEKLKFVSYPYEWSFTNLKKAAIFYLDLEIDLLKNNFVFRDGSAYNVQFTNSGPKFIDIASVKKYEPGEIRFANKQFLEEFITPLLLSSCIKIDFQKIYSIYLNGIPINILSKILPLVSYFNIFIFTNIIFFNFLEKLFENKKTLKSKKYTLSKQQLLNNLMYQKQSIAKLYVNHKTFWGNYDNQQNYSNSSFLLKVKILKNFIKKNKFTKGIDIGCNNGFFSKVCLNNGSDFIIGLDNDFNSLEVCSDIKINKNKFFLPLYYDFCKPTPGLGFDSSERLSLENRLISSKFDFTICFAAIHHFYIQGRIPLKNIVNKLLKFSDSGLLEFVTLDDQMVKIMCTNLEKNQYDDYSFNNLQNILIKKKKKIIIHPISKSRIIIEYYSK